ncbi:MAG: metalloregulator ArsR/SmtB family transcription factor [Pseudomonadota bacterium]
MTYGKAIQALADDRRRAIFDCLRDQPRTVQEIARSQPVSRPAVSQHLKVLASAGLVQVQPVGTRRYYGVRREGLLELRAWIEGFWDDVLDRFADEVERQTGGNDG